MEIREVKAWLRRIKNLDRRADMIQRQMENARARQISITANLDAVVVDGTKDPHKMDSYLELLDMYNEAVDELDRVRCEFERIMKLLDKRNHLYHEIIVYRYDLGEPWESICLTIHYGWQHTHRLHKMALIMLGEILEEQHAIE